MRPRMDRLDKLIRNLPSKTQKLRSLSDFTHIRLKMLEVLLHWSIKREKAGVTDASHRAQPSFKTVDFMIDTLIEDLTFILFSWYPFLELSFYLLYFSMTSS